MSSQTKLLGVFAALLFPLFCMSADKISPEEEKSQKQAAAVELIGRAMKIADEGRTSKSPELLIAAASMLRKAPPVAEAKDAKYEREDEAGKPVKEPEKLEQATPAELSDKFLEEAKTLAAELEKAKKMTAEQTKAVGEIADMIGKQPLERGAFGGPHRYQDWLTPRGTSRVSVPFVKGWGAAVVVRSSFPVRVTVKYGTTQVFSFQGTVVQINWMPGGGAKTPTQNFTISVQNLVNGVNSYQMITN